MFNQAILLGNLTRDPEIRYMQSGTAVAKFDIAVNERYKGRNGEQCEEVLYMRVECWQRLAENVGEYCAKGSRVLVVGQLKQDEWEDRDGNKRKTIFVRARTVQFLGEKKQQQQSSGAEPSPFAGGSAAAPAHAAARAPAAQPARPQQQAPSMPDPTAGASDDDLPF